MNDNARIKLADNEKSIEIVSAEPENCAAVDGNVLTFNRAGKIQIKASNLSR